MTAQESGAENGPTVSVIVPALNEAGEINDLIDHVRMLESGRSAEIIVVDGDPAGGTIKAVRDGSVRRFTAEKGRARQMNFGAEKAQGDILLFLHADTLLPPSALTQTASVLDNERFVAGAFDLAFRTTRRIFRLTERYVFFRTRLTRIPFGDQAIFIRRGYFNALGGFRDIPIMEDVDLMKRIRKGGGRIVIIPEKVMTSPRRYEKEGVLSCTFRNWMLQFLFMLGVSPERLARWYR
jgi:rSAM/selenodomain-associated transferase 2